MKATLLALIVLVTGCGKSPLFNHRDASATQTQTQVTPAPTTPACTLAFPNAKLCAVITWDTKPTEQEAGAFTVRFWQQDGDSAVFVDPTAQVAVQLWMPSMGHGSSPVKVTKKAVGVYSAENVFFIMPGEWDIRLQLKSAGKVVEQAVEKLTI